jgi:hypothetical protein
VLDTFLAQVTSETFKATAAVVGVFLAALGLFVNAYATLKNIKSRKLLNYQEIVKSHRDLWKLTLDAPDKYVRILAVDPDLDAAPSTEAEKRFVNLLLLHMTSAFCFGKSSDIVRIEKLREDVREVMSLPIPRAVWWESRHYFNRDFVRLVDGRRMSLARLWAWLGLARAVTPPGSRRWNILLLTGFPEKIEPIVRRFGDHVVTVSESGVAVTPTFLRQNRIDLVICFGYGRILHRDVLRRVVGINVHPGYLPYNRGPNPNLWAILDGTPRGVTIHYIDPGVDTGDIIAQRPVPLPEEGVVTLQSTFNQLVEEGVALFAKTWPEIRAGRNQRIRQPDGGTAYTFAAQAPLAALFEPEGLALPIEEFRRQALSLLKRAG